MKRLLLLVLLLVGCSGGSKEQSKIVDVYHDTNGKACFYLENSYNGLDTGVYCKQ